MKLLLLTIYVFIISCSTVNEYIDPNDTPYNYQKVENEKKQTVYKRKTVKSSEIITPISRPKKNLPEKALQISPEDKKISKTTTVKSAPSNIGTYLELNLGAGHLHGGGGLNLELGSNFDLKAGLSVFSASRIAYFGFDGGLRAKLIVKKFQFFAGVGGYLGDSKDCEDELDSSGIVVESCEKKFLSAAYTELGLRYERLAFFVRSYHITEAGVDLPVKTLIGANAFF